MKERREEEREGREGGSEGQREEGREGRREEERKEEREGGRKGGRKRGNEGVRRSWGKKKKALWQMNHLGSFLSLCVAHFPCETSSPSVLNNRHFFPNQPFITVLLLLICSEQSTQSLAF